MSGWDWLHAGLEVANYAQARKARQELESINATMLSAAEATQMEMLRKAFIEAMRKLVFDISRDLQLAEEHLEAYPMQVFIVARTSETRFRDAGLSPDVFSEFSDKEYVHSTQKKMNSVLAASRSKLTDDQMKQTEMVVKSLTELPLLNEAITAKSSLEQIQATESEWKSLEGSKNGAGTKRNFGILGLLAAPCICFGLTASSTDSSAGAVVGFLILVGAIFLLVGSRPNLPRYNELKAKRDDLRRNLLSAGEWNKVVECFGDLPSDQYQKLLEERTALINQTLGSDFQNLLAEA